LQMEPSQAVLCVGLELQSRGIIEVTAIDHQRPVTVENDDPPGCRNLHAAHG